MPARLKKSGVLRGRAAFTRLFTAGKSYSAGAIRCFYSIPERTPGTVQAGFTVTRSIRNAAVRNRVKRLMRESWRHRQSEIRNTTAGLQIAFLYYKYSARKDIHLRDIDGMIHTLVEKLNQTFT